MKEETANKIVYGCVAFAIATALYFIIGLIYMQINHLAEPSKYVQCCSSHNMSYIATFGESNLNGGMYCLKPLSNKVIPIKSVCPEL